MKIKREIAVAFALVICVVTGVTVFTYTRAARVVSSSDNISHMREVLRNIRQTGEFNSDVDLYFRQFASNREPKLYDSCKRAVWNFEGSLVALTALLKKDTIFKNSLTSFNSAADKEIVLVDSLLNGKADLNESVNSDATKAIFFGARVAIVQVRESANKMFEDQIVVNKETALSNLHFIILRLFIVLLVLLTGMLTINTQMQKRAIAENERDKLKRQYNTLLQTAADAVCKFSKRGILTYVSPNVELLSGYKYTEIVNRHYTTLIAPEWSDKLSEAISIQLKNKKRTLTREFQIVTKRGVKKWVELKTVLSNDGNDEIQFLCLCRDIDEKKKAEFATLQAARNQEVFLANMSHEIRTPMNGIIGLSHLLTHTKVSDEQAEYLKGIKDSARKLLTIINDILDISKINAGRIVLQEEPMSIQDLIHNLVLTLDGKAKKKNVTLITQLDSMPEQVLGDHVRLSQILWNLVGNAIKFSRKGGEVRITVSKQFEDPENIRLSFSIKDNGIGIERVLLPSIFEPFIQSNPAFSRKYGTGLGLSIAKKLVELQGGTIVVDSTEGKGSVFSFRVNFKKYQFDSPAGGGFSPVGITTNPFQPLKGVNVLLAEDNLINQKVGAKMLEKWGLKVDVADNGKRAVDLMLLNRYDLVLMDLQMPEMNGFEATNYIRTKMDGTNSNVPIIAITAAALNGEYEKCLASGMNDYILKPFEPKELADKINNLVHLQQNILNA